MTKRKKELLITVVLLFIVSLIYVLLVKFIDVKSIGPESSKVGFSGINGWVHDLTGYNETWYKITKYLGIIPFILVAYYAFIGLKQLIKYKKLSKVDKRIILLGVFYVLVGITFIFFEKVIINYRPVLEDGVLEASFPSTHTLLAVCVCYSSIIISKYYVSKKYLKAFNIATSILMIVLVIGRLLSGVHWLTDILGGIIISIFLVTVYRYLIYKEKE